MLGKGHFIVVDDDSIVRELGAAQLAALGFTTESFGDSVAASVRLSNLVGVRGIVLDLAMPGMDGATIYRMIRERDPQVAVIISSGYAGGGHIMLTHADPRLRFMPKPWRQADLSGLLIELGVLDRDPSTADA